MSKYSWIYNTLFVLLAILAFFLVGIFFVLVFDLAKGQGLAGGAIVLGYGVVGGVIGLVFSIWVLRQKKYKIRSVMSKILIVVGIALSGYFYWNYQTNVKPKREKSKLDMPQASEPKPIKKNSNQ
jgi:hypothetical membrane protein